MHVEHSFCRTTDSSLFSVNELLSFLAWPVHIVLAGLTHVVTLRIAQLQTVCILVVTPVHCNSTLYHSQQIVTVPRVLHNTASLFYNKVLCFQIAYKLLDLYRRLRELGHYHYIEDCALQLPCSISPCEALERVDELQSSLQSWAEEVAALRNQYKWLLFFNVPKLLRLYKTLKCLWNEDEEEKIVNQISCEVAFLCTNSKEMRTKIVADIKVICCEVATELQHNYVVYIQKVNKHHKDDERAPVEIVGSFLHELFLDHSLHQVSLQGHMHSHRQILHCCHHFSLSELIQQIIGIYHPDIPKVFQIFRCQKITTEEELKLLFERAKNFPLKYVVFDVNKLSYKLQEVCVIGSI